MEYAMKLLFDDDAIDRTAGVRRVLGSPKKEPDPILEPQMPWETAGEGDGPERHRDAGQRVARR